MWLMLYLLGQDFFNHMHYDYPNSGLEIFENMLRTNVLEAKKFTGHYDIQDTNDILDE